MLTKEILMNDVGKSSFARLAEYITNDQGNSLRVQDVKITNCHSQTLKEAVQEITATQQQNVKTKKDKTFHVLLSFRAGDEAALTPETREKIEREFCDRIGFGGHQRISAYHGDTDNPHIHIAINRIDPVTHRMNNPKGLWRKMSDAAEAIEKEYGISMLNHRSEKTISEARVNDAESMSHEETLCSYIRKIDALNKAKSWAEFHQICRDNSIRLQLRGNGLIFTNGEIHVKASTVNRAFSKSKLEKLYGKFAADGADVPPEGDNEHEEIRRQRQQREQEQEQEQERQREQRQRQEDERLEREREQKHERRRDRNEQKTENTYRKGTPKDNLYTEEQKQLYEDFVQEKRLSGYDSKKEHLFEETRDNLRFLVEKRRKEFERIQKSRVSYRIKQRMYQKLKEQIAKDREMYILSQRYTLRKLRQQGTWKGYLHSKALDGDQTAIELLERQKQRAYDAERVKELEQRLSKVAETAYVTKGGTRIYRTDTHYIHIAKDRIKIQRIDAASGNRSRINWKQGFSSVNIADVIRNDPVIEKLIAEENERRRQQQRQEKEKKLGLMARIIDAARRFSANRKSEQQRQREQAQAQAKARQEQQQQQRQQQEQARQAEQQQTTGRTNRRR